MKKTTNRITLTAIPVYTTDPKGWQKNIPYVEDYMVRQMLAIYADNCHITTEGDNLLVFTHKDYEWIVYKFAVGVKADVNWPKGNTNGRAHAIIHSTYRTMMLTLIRGLRDGRWA